MRKFLAAGPQGGISSAEAPSSDDSIACVKMPHKTTQHSVDVCQVHIAAFKWRLPQSTHKRLERTRVLGWLALIVNLTQSTITGKENLNEELLIGM